MKMDSGNKVVLISGCSSGIGRALANEFATRNYRVFATARKSSSIGIRSPRVDISALDVTKKRSIEACVKHVLKKAGKIDILINNAGYGLMGPIIDIPLADFSKQFETNVTGLVALTQAAAPHMIQARSGMIVNISSVSGVTPTPFSGAYCATKSAVNAISDVLRMELAPFGISVLTIQPGGIKSGFGSTAAKTIEKKKNSVYAPVIKYIIGRATASQRNSNTAEELAHAVADVLEKDRIPPLVRFGIHSTRMPLMKKLPIRLLDKILIKRSGLIQLMKKN
jgi:NAD(P)-dependent dehydrogenase (short-subunit alcohol dehydrogenase family)